jgi:acyl-coenzyme A thioesterase PaaI-like protein
MTRVSSTVLARLISSEPYYRFLDLRTQPGNDTPAGHDDDTEIIFVLPGHDRHIGDPGRRTVHGGILAAFLEAAAVLYLRATDDTRVVVVDFTSEFLRPAAIASTSARVVVVRRGKRFANLRVEAWQDDTASPVAVGYGRFLRAPP